METNSYPFTIISKQNTTTDVPNEAFAILVNKLQDWTSFDVVNKLRYHFKIKKVGHAGTLDPFATGLLIVCLGKKATKQIDTFQDKTKGYRAVIELGKATDTYDITGSVTKTSDKISTKEEIREVVNSFIGEIDQVPPMYSAIKIKGKKLYELARKGEEIERKPRKINIHNIKIINIDYPLVELDITCSKGTYIRSLAYDIGEKIGCYGYLKELERTKIGEFDVKDSLTIDEIISRFS